MNAHSGDGPAVSTAPGGGERAGAGGSTRSSAAIFGCAGLRLGDEERAFFSDAAPWGFILFSRNVESPEQVAALVDALRSSVGWNAPILIDQEGGRVARLRPPNWRDWPPVGAWCARADSGEIAETELWEMLTLRYRLIADELRAIGIDVNCAPLLDLQFDGADPIIGDRALGREVKRVSARGAVICSALRAGGVAPVIKHLPGHGRAAADSHVALPVVDADRGELLRYDFAPFMALRDEPIGMTAHVVYSDVDAAAPATLSSTMIETAIRGVIGFDGLLVTDDLSMGALSEICGPGVENFARRAELSLAAGCDVVLHCNGDLEEMRAVMRGVGGLDGVAARRARAALRACEQIDPFDARAGAARLEEAAASLSLAV